MNQKRNGIPMSIPGIGGGQQQPFDLSQVERRVCKACKSEFFDKVYRMGMISKFASRNTLNQDVIVEYSTYICRECGWEFSVDIEEKQ